MWFRVLDSYLIGPHFINGCLAAAYYKDSQQNDLPLYSEYAPLATQGRCEYMTKHLHISAEQ
jgi:hypothetical protein